MVQMKQLKPTLLLAAIWVVIVALIGYHAVYKRQENKRRQVRSQITNEQKNQQMQADVAALLEQVEQYKKRLPREPDPSWLVREAMELGKAAGIELTSITQENPKKFKQFTQLAVKLQFAASYHKLGIFLDHIEHSKYFVRADKIDASPSRTPDEPAAIKLTLSTIYVPELTEEMPGGS